MATDAYSVVSAVPKHATRVSRLAISRRDCSRKVDHKTTF